MQKAFSNILRDTTLSYAYLDKLKSIYPSPAYQDSSQAHPLREKHIDLHAEITKDGDCRIVDMSDNMVEWLLPCGKESGPPLPVNFRRKRCALYRAMGWNLADHRNAALTAEQMGHRNARMLYAHYREVVKETSDIEEFWKLTPGRSGQT